MIQEEKELLLKDLCARLPYNPMVEYKGRTYNVLGAVHGRLVLCKPFMSHTLDEHPLVEEVKPYLFPLSSMTEEQWIDLKEYSDFKYDGCLLDLVKYTDSVSTLEFWVEEIPCNIIIMVFDWLNKNHFDYRGLIQLGLAINATGLNIY